MITPADRYRCLCGISLFATPQTHPRQWPRHAAHIAAFQRHGPPHDPDDIPMPDDYPERARP